MARKYVITSRQSIISNFKIPYDERPSPAKVPTLRDQTGDVVTLTHVQLLQLLNGPSDRPIIRRARVRLTLEAHLAKKSRLRSLSNEIESTIQTAPCATQNSSPGTKF